MIDYQEENYPFGHIKWGLIPTIIKRYFFRLVNENVDVYSQNDLDLRNLKKPFYNTVFYDSFSFSFLDPDEEMNSLFEGNIHFYNEDSEYQLLTSDQLETLFDWYNSGFYRGQEKLLSEIKDYSSKSVSNDSAIVHFIFKNLFDLDDIELGRIADRVEEIKVGGTAMKILSRSMVQGGGYCAGKLLATWEIVLNNPLQFESIFLKAITGYDGEFDEKAPQSGFNLSDRIRFLNELGVIDFLNQKYQNENGVAKILANIIGGNTRSIQSFINQINTQGKDSKDFGEQSKPAGKIKDLVQMSDLQTRK